MRIVKILGLMVIIFLAISLVKTVYGRENSRLEKLLTFDESEIGYASLSSTDDTLLVSYGYSFPDEQKPGTTFWVRNGKKIKSINNLDHTKISPDGNHYMYIKNHVIYVNDKKDTTIRKISTLDMIRPGEWSYDSKSFYFMDRDYIYNYNISTGVKKVILLKKQYCKIITVKNNNVIYLLKDTNDDPIEPTREIYRYDILKKEFTQITLPKLKNFSVTDDFTISPDEKIIMFNNIFLGMKHLYVIDAINFKFIDELETPMNCRNDFDYSWKTDSSYVIFTMDYKEIYKYTIPTTTVLFTEETDQLTSEYARYYHQFPGNKELSPKEQQEEISEANSLSDEGFNYYKDKKDDLAIAKYQDALQHYASAEIYYRYGNSLSNIPCLEDAVKAYQIAIELNYDKPGLVYYNIACVYSRMNHSKEAFANLELAINNGYKNFDHIQKDDDLVWLRSQPEWKEWWLKHQQ